MTKFRLVRPVSTGRIGKILPACMARELRVVTGMGSKQAFITKMMGVV